MRFLRILTILMSFFCLALSALSALSPSIVQIMQCDFFFYICDSFAERDGAGGKIDFVYCQGYYPVYIRLALPHIRQAFFLRPPFYHLYLFTTCIFFFYSLYLFLKKPSKKDTSFSLRSNPRGYSREPIFSVYARASMRA